MAYVTVKWDLLDIIRGFCRYWSWIDQSSPMVTGWQYGCHETVGFSHSPNKYNILTSLAKGGECFLFKPSIGEMVRREIIYAQSVESKMGLGALEKFRPNAELRQYARSRPFTSTSKPRGLYICGIRRKNFYKINDPPGESELEFRSELSQWISAWYRPSWRRDPCP